MSAHGIFGGAAAGLVFFYIALALFVFILYLMAMWGLYLAGKSQQAVAALYKKHLELVAFQTDYIQRVAIANEEQAQQAKNQAAAVALVAERAEKPLEVVMMHGAD